MSNKNVVLITVDSLREDSHRIFREQNNTNTGDLSKRGTSFTQAIANGPNTPTSFPSILTGTYQISYGGYDYLSNERPFISSTLQRNGYSTVAFHSNPHLGPNKNYDNGFDIFNNRKDENKLLDRIIGTVDSRINQDSAIYSILRRAWHLIGSSANISAYDSAESITNDAIDWLEKRDDKRFFLWIHYMDVHYPFQPPNKFLENMGYDSLSSRRKATLNDMMEENPQQLTRKDLQELKALYRGEIHYVDHHIGRIFDKLSDQGIRDETMIVFTADHGEAFGEHNRWGHHPYMYDELLQVPLIIDDPDIEPGVVERQVSLIDIFPTICESCNIKKPTKLQGDSVFKKEEEVEFAASNGGKRLAARTPEWKCLWHIINNQIELYHLSTDPGETEDVSGDNPDVVEWLKGEMKEYRDIARATDTELPDVEESEEVKQRLRDLGYTE